MTQVVDMGLHEKVFILAGVGPLRSAKQAEWMRRNIPGVSIPDTTIMRLKDAGKKSRTEGQQICVESIQRIQEIEGVAGIHVMAYKQEEVVPEILKAGGLLPRPTVSEAWRDFDAVE